MTTESFDVIPAAEIYDGVRLSTDMTPEMGAMSAPKGVALVLHGFDLMKNHQPGQALLVAVDWLRFKLEKQGYQVIFGRYNTHQSFVFGAQEIAAYLRNNNVPTNNLSIFAYSMGGLVARQMIANGLTPRRLFTYCTPHLGTMLHVLPINYGAMSMMPVSQELG
ncbi:MAG: putative lipase, partial [Paracoccaceae bacterium]|nr:putative lipase [Paracoccaceae bacterium]